MSTPTDPGTAAIIYYYSTATLVNYCTLGRTAFILYEWTITSGQTISMFWKTRLTGASILFLANRYIVFVFNAITFLGFIRMSDKSCTGLAQSTEAVQLSQYIPWAAFSALRVLALCRSWVLSGFVLLLSLAPVGINLTQFHFDLAGVSDPKLDCVFGVNVPPDLAKNNLILVILSRTCLITADVIVIAVTWYTMPRLRTSHVGSRQNTSTLSAILWRDGTIYFILLLILNSLHLALSLISVDIVSQQASYMTVFTESLTAVIVSRFLLNLQSANRKMLQLDHENMTHTVSSGSSSLPTDSVVFAWVIGSIGSSTLPDDSNAPGLEDDDDNRLLSSFSIRVPDWARPRAATIVCIHSSPGTCWL